MHTTTLTLLARLTDPAEAPAAWATFVRVYTPLMLDWCRRMGLPDADAADLAQDVFLTVLRKLPALNYDPARGCFRKWLRAVMVNRWRDLQSQRRPGLLGETVPAVADPRAPDPAALFAEGEYRDYLVGRVLHLLRTDFKPATWKAFWECTVNDRPAQEVADELGVQLSAVYNAKSRVLARLRQELSGLPE